MTNEPTTNEQSKESAPVQATDNQQTEVIDATQTETLQGSSKNMWVGIVITVIILVLGYVFLFTDTKLANIMPFNKGTVALVNGVAINQIEFQNSVKNVTEAYVQQGLDIEDPATKDVINSEAVKRLINTELLLQAASKAGYTADDARVEEQVEVLTKEFGGKEALMSRLAELQIDERMLHNDVREQIIVSNYLEKETAVGSITVNDEEVAIFYENLKTQYGEQLPPLEDIRTQVEADIRVQKQQGVLSEILADLRAAAEVEVRI